MLNAINLKGHLFIKNYVKIENKNFSDSEEIFVIAEILNLFLAELFHNQMKDFQKEKEYKFFYLGFEDENIKNLILMTKYLANWLFHFNFVDYRLEINVDF